MPEAEPGADAQNVLRERYAVRAGEPKALGSFVHSFSHYHLQVTPLVVAGTRVPRVADDAGRGWYARDEWQALGLPAPVRKLLETVFEDERWLEPSTA